MSNHNPINPVSGSAPDSRNSKSEPPPEPLASKPEPPPDSQASKPELAMESANQELAMVMETKTVSQLNAEMEAAKKVLVDNRLALKMRSGEKRHAVKKVGELFLKGLMQAPAEVVDWLKSQIGLMDDIDDRKRVMVGLECFLADKGDLSMGASKPEAAKKKTKNWRKSA